MGFPGTDRARQFSVQGVCVLGHVSGVTDSLEKEGSKTDWREKLSCKSGSTNDSFSHPTNGQLQSGVFTFLGHSPQFQERKTQTQGLPSATPFLPLTPGTCHTEDGTMWLLSH